MCAHFLLKSKANEISKRFGIKISEDLNFDVSVRGYMKIETAPIILFENRKLIIKEACFSLCPAWSKEFPCPFTTYNARLERVNSKNGKTEFIYQAPTWKESFITGKTCLVPMNFAIESSYFGSHAGQMIKFSTKKEDVFYVTGLYSDWIDKKSGEVHETFTLLTDDPYRFFFEAGHDRSVVVIDDSKQEEWLSNKKMNSEERFKFLRKSRISLDWKAETEREMKKGWEKRAPSKEEISSMKVWDV